MARTARMKLTGEGTAYYHLMSRTNDKRFLFEKGRVKTEMVAALRRAAAFSGIELKALVAMDNHFHVVCKVTRGAGPVWYYIARRWTRRQYSGLKDCRVLEYDTGQQVPGKHLL